MKRLAALVVSDGLPGHVSQSRGLVRLLGERFDLHTEELEVALRAKAVSRIALPIFLNRGGSALAAYRLCHRGGLPRQRPDLVVSAGGNTACANILLARHWQLPNVFLGSRRHVASHCFTAHMTLEPTGEAANIVMDVAPSPLSREQIEQGGCRFVAAHGLAGERLWLMACGGNGAGKAYRPRHWRALGRWMNAIAERHCVRWLVSTSRRTGAAGEQALRGALAAEHVAHAVWWREGPRRILGDLMGAAERLFVTVDSMSMIGECIATGKHLVLVHSGAGQPNERYRDALAKYERLGTCHNATVDAPYEACELTLPPMSALFAAQLDELEARIGAACGDR